MDGMVLFSKFKNSLDSVIDGYKEKIVDIEKKEEFLQVLSDLVNYCKDDASLLPFYDEGLLSRVLEAVYPVFDHLMSKISVAKYLIESSGNVDRKHFPQYNSAMADLGDINNKIIDYYNDLVSNNSYAFDKESYNTIINNYSSILKIIGDGCFSGLIDNVDLFHDVLLDCNLSNDEINGILNIAITSNLGFLGDNGFTGNLVDGSL